MMNLEVKRLRALGETLKHEESNLIGIQYNNSYSEQ